MKEQVIELIINCLPAIIALITCMASTFKIMAGLKEWKDSNDMSSVAQLETDLKNVVKENIELKKNIQKVLNENEELREELKKILILITVQAEQENSKEEIKEG